MAVKIKIMPSSPDEDLEVLKEKLTNALEVDEGKNPSFETEDIAFGLKALIVTFGWPEDKEFEEFENKLKTIEGVGSSETMDMRRVFG
ncbi:MAG: elongation factor 1-beta [Nanoarchaeota archaeon]|nr:elongation factor 1-beta [Nanoarchaeota archaeon]MBU1501466.1 elongation factor 1-beta [Nanoarchaeota archaeon]MBU2459229.1 elongation factor 1-beta [Nanoarchaeota archaeon]